MSDPKNANPKREPAEESVEASSSSTTTIGKELPGNWKDRWEIKFLLVANLLTIITVLSNHYHSCESLGLQKQLAAAEENKYISEESRNALDMLANADLQKRINGLLLLKTLIDESPLQTFHLQRAIEQFIRASTVKGPDSRAGEAGQDVQIAFEVLGAAKAFVEPYNFSGLHLKGLNLSGLVFLWANFSSTTFEDASMSKFFCYSCFFSDATFLRVSGDWASFTKSTFSSADFVFSGLHMTDFRDCVFSNAYFCNSEFHYSKFLGSSFSHTRFLEAHFPDVQFEDTSLEEAIIDSDTRFCGSSVKTTFPRQYKSDDAECYHLVPRNKSKCWPKKPSP